MKTRTLMATSKCCHEGSFKVFLLKFWQSKKSFQLFQRSLVFDSVKRETKKKWGPLLDFVITSLQ